MRRHWLLFPAALLCAFAVLLIVHFSQFPPDQLSISDNREPYIRLIIFVLTLVIIGAAESLFPRRSRTFPRPIRWINNLGLVVLGGFLVRILFPILPVTLGALCERNHWGLLQSLDLPEWAQITAGILLLDLGIYWQHRAFHVDPLLWKIHRVHHVDPDYDATTGLRFHPIEIILSMLYKVILVLVLGVPFLGVLLFEIILNSCALFNHGNLYIPGLIDRYLRLAIITPDFHRVHHSADAPEMNMNYGFSFPWWDRIFGTYKAQPEKGHTDMTIGLHIFRARKYLTLPRMLAIPFIRL